jgi:hypothetical protein
VEEGENSLGSYLMQNKIAAKFAAITKPMPLLRASEQAQRERTEREEREERERRQGVKRAVREFEIWGFEICV